MTKFPKNKGFQLRSGNRSPFREMGSMEPMEKVGMEKLDTPKLSDKPIETTKTFEETSAEIKAEKKAAKKAARKEKMKEIGKALVDTSKAITRSDLAGGEGGIIDNYDKIQEQEKSKTLEDKSQNILNTHRQLSNQQKIEDFMTELDGEDKMPPTNPTAGKTLNTSNAAIDREHGWKSANELSQMSSKERNAYLASKNA